MNKLYAPIALIIVVICALTFTRNSKEMSSLVEPNHAEANDTKLDDIPSRDDSSAKENIPKDDKNVPILEGIEMFSKEVHSVPNFKEINAIEVLSSNNDVNVRGLKSALNRDGAIFVGNVKRLTAADEIRKPAVVWGVADIEVKDVIWGDVESEISVPFAFDDFDLIKQLMKDGKSAHTHGFVWNSFQQDRSSDYLFVIQEGYENRVLSKEDDIELGASRWAHKMSKIESGVSGEKEKWEKVVTVYKNDELMEMGKAVDWLLNHTSDTEGFHRFALEALIMQIAPLDSGYAIGLIKDFMDSPETEKLVALALSDAKRDWKAKRHQYSLSSEELEKLIVRMSNIE